VGFNSGEPEMIDKWLEVDPQGFASVVKRRQKGAIVAELISNAWDSGTKKVSVRVTPVAGLPRAIVEVEDWGEGFANLSEAYTLFAPSRRSGDASKRGRFNRGEKDVLSIAVSAEISTVCGTILFEADGRRNSKAVRPKGTLFKGELKLSRDECQEVKDFIQQMIPPVETTLDGLALVRSTPDVRFKAQLPTEITREEGDGEIVRKQVMRECEVEVYDLGGGTGDILEMGIPVVECSMPYRINVLQKVPLTSDRDNVPPGFLKQLQVAVLNHMHDRLDEEQAKEPWAAEASGHGGASKDAVASVLRKRFGERAVSATPNDPAANATAEAQGYTVIPGGAMNSGLWSNVKKHGLVIPASRAFPTPRPEQRASGKRCPTCGR